MACSYLAQSGEGDGCALCLVSSGKEIPDIAYRDAIDLRPQASSLRCGSACAVFLLYHEDVPALPMPLSHSPTRPNRLKERCRLFRSLGNPSRHTWRHRISTGDIAGARGAEPEKTPRPFPRTCRNAWPEDSVASRRDSSWNPRRSCPRLRSYSHTPRQPCPLAG
jgi:hypothetical protein